MSIKQFHSGHWYHVYARSMEEVPLFELNQERIWFIDKLDEVFARRKIGIAALCLMNSHYHALVKMGSVRLDRALNGLHMSYAKHINHTRDRRGTVFEKHPGTDIVLSDSYLLQLVPYIHLNPVKAGMVDAPSEYEWHTDSMYRTGEWKHGPLESWEWPPHFQEENRNRIYRERLGETIELPRSDEGYIGFENEWKNLEKRSVERSGRTAEDRRDRCSMEEIALEIVSDYKNISVGDLKQKGRGQPEAELRQKVMVEMYREGYGPVEIGRFFNRDKGTVSYAIRKLTNDSE